MITGAPAPPFSVAAISPRLASVADRLLGLHALQRMYEALPPGDFVDTALASLGVEVAAPLSSSIPQSGPVVVVANHPTGALDGLALLSVLRRRRADVRVMANHLLHRVPEMRAWTIPVNPFAASAANPTGMRAARRWLANGGLLLVFPAGEVSSEPRGDGTLADGPWHPMIARLIRATAATVVPVFVSGHTSRWFRLAGRLHPMARTALLPRELLRRRGSRVDLAIGGAIPCTRLDRLAADEARLAYLRARTYGLAPVGPARSAPLVWRARHRDTVQIAAPEPIGDVTREVQSLSPHRRVASGTTFDVYAAPAAEIPSVLREIGRLREVTFRAAGEGTGRARDLDRFDDSYLHLFLWHRERRQIAGAYRVGATDRIAGSHDPRGLYSRTLFRFGPALLREMGPALELGRSFIRPECQRDPAALLMLWKGIGQLVVREPRYRRLFGPVSISADYRSLSRDLLARFLTTSSLRSPLARLVRPRTPVRAEVEAVSLVRTRVVSRIDDLETMVAEIECGRRLPVLVRQYLKLNARLLGFSVDPAFGNVLDGLMLVDLLDVPSAALDRYLGRDGAAAFRAYHRRDDVMTPAGAEPVVTAA
jgi:putative hemolysin